MSGFDDPLFADADFSGKVRLFPLPNLVLFPHVMQPLHIFEPRYRCLLEDALATDRLITMALLAPGWEGDYEGRPPLYPMGCLGRVTTFHRLEDGTYNLLLLGLRRVQLVHELNPRRLYREAEATIANDENMACSNATQVKLQRRLRNSFARILPLLSEAQEQMDQLLATDIPLGVLTDVISFMLEINVVNKAALLAEVDVYRRAELLLQHLDAIAANKMDSAVSSSSFPPRFSMN